MTLTNKNFADLITFARTGTATRVNSLGLIEAVAADTPRFDYDPVTLAAKGLLIEDARTNLCLHSDDFTNAAWTKTNVTAAKTATGPDGVTNSASTLTATAANGTALQAITSASAARVTSCWIKRRTGAGTVEMTQDNGATWSAVTVTSVWTRVEIPSATLTDPTVGLRIVTSGDEIDVALFQHEVGAFVTSAIPTTSATVTRNADDASITGTDFSDWFNASEGTMYVEATSVDVGDSGLFALESDANNRMFTQFTNGGNFQIRVAGVTEAQITGSDPTAGVFSKFACAFKANDVCAAMDGVVGTTDTSVSIPTVDTLQIGNRLGGGYLNGHIKDIRFYPTRLSNAELQELTA